FDRRRRSTGRRGRPVLYSGWKFANPVRWLEIRQRFVGLRRLDTQSLMRRQCSVQMYNTGGNMLASYQTRWALGQCMTRLFCIGFLLSFAASGLGDEKSDAELLKEAQENFKPLPQDMATKEYPISAERVSLGRKLFFDPRISVDGTVSCSRCH